jgi:hypothetical protein
MIPKIIFSRITITIRKNVRSKIILKKYKSLGSFSYESGTNTSPIPPPALRP